MFQGSFKECFKEVSKVFQGRFKGVSGKFQKCFKEVSRVFQGSFKGVSRKCQGCFMIFLRSFTECSRCFKFFFHVAWHSSQLPEQKEGLFSS